MTPQEAQYMWVYQAGDICDILNLSIFPWFSVVIEALKNVDSSRKCFRMIGGVLVERTVGDVLPALENNRKQVQ